MTNLGVLLDLLLDCVDHSLHLEHVLVQGAAVGLHLQGHMSERSMSCVDSARAVTSTHQIGGQLRELSGRVLELRDLLTRTTRLLVGHHLVVLCGGTNRKCGKCDDIFEGVTLDVTGDWGLSTMRE